MAKRIGFNQLPENEQELVKNLADKYRKITQASKSVKGFIDDIKPKNLSKNKSIIEVDYYYEEDDLSEHIEGTKKEILDKVSMFLDKALASALSSTLRSYENEDDVIFTLIVQSCGYDGIEEWLNVKYDSIETEHEFQERQDNIKDYKLLLETVVPIVNNIEQEQNKEKVKQEYEKELAKLKKKYKVE